LIDYAYRVYQLYFNECNTINNTKAISQRNTTHLDKVIFYVELTSLYGSCVCVSVEKLA
jgi:hypothetical protein